MSQSVEQAFIRPRTNQNRLREQGTWMPVPGFETLIFTGHKGKPLLTASVQNMLNRITKEINAENHVMKHLHPHMMRHSFATRCFELGIPPKTVQILLGHANIQITLDLYTHVSDEKKIQDMQKLDKIL